MHKSILINDTFDNLSFGINECIHKNNYSNNGEPFTESNITLDDSIFNDITHENPPEVNNHTKSNATKTTLITQTRKPFTQGRKITQSDPAIRSLSSWGLPSTVLEEYASRKLTTMFPWQCECLLSDSDILSKQKNLIYSAPTSAGKTLVAEILAIKTVLERGKKVIFILPFISVVREKMTYLQDILGTSGIRVEGYMGSYNPPGGFQNINIAICTMEKANGLINKLLEDGNLSSIGAVIVDELHLLGDPSRGYILELLLTKLLYMTNKTPDIRIQIIGMSATLPNLHTLADWLNACLYTTQFRPIPLIELCQINSCLFDHQMNLLRKLDKLDGVDTDVDNILQLCLETIKQSCSVLIFCPSKQWCETLALQIAEAFYKLGSTPTTDVGKMLRAELSEELIKQTLQQLISCPVGLDTVLKKTVSFAVAFHHAGLTMDERDIVESAFRAGVIRVIVATSTLSSGVNLPAKRVIVRTPRTMGSVLDVFAYRQMIGRAGRMGKDTSGDSVLLCKAGDERIARKLMGDELSPVESCLEGGGKLKRAILEVISSGVAISNRDVALFTNCTLLAKTTIIINPNLELENKHDPISEAINFLIENEFIKKHVDENNETIFVPTSLARACLSASMAPDEGLALFSELERARRCIVLETDLHLVYMVTPYNVCSSWPQIDWMQYLDMWERLGQSMRRVGDLVGVRSSFLSRAVQTSLSTNNYNKDLLIHKRFFISLALQDLINEVPLNAVSTKYSCNRGLLQSLQQSAATFAGMVTSFSRQLGWASVELLIGQLQDRLHFGVTRELLDLMRLPLLNGQRARILHSSGIETLVNLANCSTGGLEAVLLKGTPFISDRFNEKRDIRCVWVNSRNEGLTEHEAAVLLVSEARRFLQLELGLDEAKWCVNTHASCLEFSDEENLVEKLKNSSLNDDKNTITNLTSTEKNCDNKIATKKQEINNSSTKTNLNLIDQISNNSYCQTTKSNNLSVAEINSENLFDNSKESDSIFNYTEIIEGQTENILNLHLSSESNLNTAVNTSKDILFEDSFDCNVVNIILSEDCVKNDSALEQAFASSFCKDENANEDILDASDTIVEDSPKNNKVIYETSRILKRSRLDVRNVLINSPTKKSKYNLESQTDVSNMQIVDVCETERELQIFADNLLEQKIVAISLACNLLANPKQSIGPTRFTLKHPEAIKYVYKNVKLIGICFYWKQLAQKIYFLPLHEHSFDFEAKIDILLRNFFATDERHVFIFDAKQQIKILSTCCRIKFACFAYDPIIADWILEPENVANNIQDVVG